MSCRSFVGSFVGHRAQVTWVNFELCLRCDADADAKAGHADWLYIEVRPQNRTQQGQGRAGREENILLAKCIDRCGVSCGRLWLVSLSFVKSFQHSFLLWHTRERFLWPSEGCAQISAGGEGRQRHFAGVLIKCQFAALNGGFIGRHYNSYA